MSDYLLTLTISPRGIGEIKERTFCKGHNFSFGVIFCQASETQAGIEQLLEVPIVLGNFRAVGPGACYNSFSSAAEAALLLQYSSPGGLKTWFQVLTEGEGFQGLFNIIKLFTD